MANWRPLTMGNPVSSSSGPSSSSSSEEAPTRPDIIDGFERKSVALLDYVNNLEAQLEQLRASYEHKEARLLADRAALEAELSQRLSRLLSDKKSLEEKLLLSHDHHSCAQKSLLAEERKRLASDEAVKTLKLDARAAQDLLQNERNRSKELEEKIAHMKEQVRSKEHNFNRQKLKDEREKTKLEEDMAILKKKVSLGWILGCLSEVYLRLENENKDHKKDEVVSDLFKDLEKPVDVEAIEKEIRQMMDDHDSSHSHKKRLSSSSKQGLEDDSLMEGLADLDLDSLGDAVAATADNCKPCRFMRSALQQEHGHHHS